MIRVAVAALAALILASCTGGASPATQASPSASPTTPPSPTTEATMTASPSPSTTFTLTSTAFGAGAAIPAKYGCDAAGPSPPLAWSGVPAGTAELELLVDDPDAHGFVHWVAAGIAPTTTGLDERATGSSAIPVEGRNGAGRTGWTPPCPPSGTHHYHFTLYAVSKPLGLRAGVSADELRAAAKSATIGTAELTGTFKRG
jgi:Raf kinase inhibitor-like YbhB/YbcL family protein